MVCQPELAEGYRFDCQYFDIPAIKPAFEKATFLFLLLLLLYY